MAKDVDFRDDTDLEGANPMDLDRVEQTTMDPARLISDSLIQEEGFSEEQAFEIALSSGQSAESPLEDELTITLEEMEEDINDTAEPNPRRYADSDEESLDRY